MYPIKKTTLPQLAILYMKAVGCIITSQNDTFANRTVYHSNVTENSYKLYDQEYYGCLRYADDFI